MGISLTVFLFFHKSIRCGYSIEAPCWGASNEFHNICFHQEIRNLPILFKKNKRLIKSYVYICTDTPGPLSALYCYCLLNISSQTTWLPVRIFRNKAHPLGLSFPKGEGICFNTNLCLAIFKVNQWNSSQKFIQLVSLNKSCGKQALEWI